MKLLGLLGSLIFSKLNFIPLVNGQWGSSWSIHPNSSIFDQQSFQVFRNIAISGGRVCSYYNQVCTVNEEVSSNWYANGLFYSESSESPIYYIAVDGTNQLSIYSIAGTVNSISVVVVKRVRLDYQISALDIDYIHRWLVVSGPAAAMSLNIADPINPTLVSTVTYNRTGIGEAVRAISVYKDTFCSASESSFFRCTDFKDGVISPAFRYYEYPYQINPFTDPLYATGIRVYDDIVVVMGIGLDSGTKVELYNRTTWQFLSRLSGAPYYQYDVIRSSHFLLMTDESRDCVISSIEDPKSPQVMWTFSTHAKQGEQGSRYQFMDETTLYVSTYEHLSIITLSFPPGMDYSSFYKNSEFNGYGLAKPFLHVERNEPIHFHEMGFIPFNSTSLIVIDTYMPENTRIRYFVETPLAYFQLTVDAQSLKSTDSFSVNDLESDRVLIKPVSLDPRKEVMKIKACYQGNCISTEIELIVSPRPSQTPAPDPSKNSPSDTDTTNWWMIFTLIIWACAFMIFFLLGFLAYSYGAVQGIFQSEKTSVTFYSDMTDSSLVSAFSYTSAEASTTQTGTSSYSSADVTLQAGSTKNSTQNFNS